MMELFKIPFTLPGILNDVSVICQRFSIDDATHTVCNMTHRRFIISQYYVIAPQNMHIYRQLNLTQLSGCRILNTKVEGLPLNNKQIELLTQVATVVDYIIVLPEFMNSVSVQYPFNNKLISPDYKSIFTDENDNSIYEISKFKIISN